MTVLDSGTIVDTTIIACNWDARDYADSSTVDGSYEIILEANYGTSSTIDNKSITIDNTLPIAEITSPGETLQSSRVFGIIDILGTVNDENFASYKLEVIINVIEKMLLT